MRRKTNTQREASAARRLSAYTVFPVMDALGEVKYAVSRIIP